MRDCDSPHLAELDEEDYDSLLGPPLTAVFGETCETKMFKYELCMFHEEEYMAMLSWP